MATNPMQRRARNSFLAGVLITLLIMAIVVVGLLYKIINLSEVNDSLVALQKEVFILNQDLESGAVISPEMMNIGTVQSDIDISKIVTIADLEVLDERGNVKNVITKTALPEGTIVTKDMIAVDGEQTTDDVRIQEYNMIILPIELAAGDYIDIRFKLPTGQDYIVISKKYVKQVSQDTIWIDITEAEILTLGNAIIEAYIIEGSKIYATTYLEPGLQVAATPTYPVSAEVLSLINKDPNIVEEARNALWQRYNSQEQVVQRNEHLNSALQKYVDDMESRVNTGVTDEITRTQAAREEYLTMLDGGTPLY